MNRDDIVKNEAEAALASASAEGRAQGIEEAARAAKVVVHLTGTDSTDPETLWNSGAWAQRHATQKLIAALAAAPEPAPAQQAAEGPLDCPFCGSQAIAEESASDGKVFCTICAASILRRHYRRTNFGVSDAVAAWNRRTPAPSLPSPAPAHRHKKRGTECVLIGIGKMQAEQWVERTPALDHDAWMIKPIDMCEVAIYRSAADGSLRVCPLTEWEDGRFEARPTGSPSPAPSASGEAIRPMCIYPDQKDDLAAFKASSPRVQAAWNVYCQREADAQNADADSDRTTNLYHQWGPPLRFRAWAAAQPKTWM